MPGKSHVAKRAGPQKIDVRFQNADPRGVIHALPEGARRFDIERFEFIEQVGGVGGNGGFRGWK